MSDGKTLRNIIILIGSSFSVMAGASVAPALTAINSHFKDVENAQFLVKILLSAPALCIAIFSPVIGLLLDKFSTKRILLFSNLLFGLAGTGGFFIDDLLILIISRIILGISVAGIMTGYISLIGDLFKGKEIDTFIGYQAAVMSLGGVVYLMLSGLLADIQWNYPFLMFSVAFILAFGLQFTLTETKSKTDKQANSKLKVILSGKLIIIYILAFVAMALYLMVPSQLGFLMKELKNSSSSEIGIFMTSWIFASSIASILYKKIITRTGYNLIFALSLAIWAVGYIIIWLSNGLAPLLAGLILSGIGNGLLFPNLKALLLNSVGIEYKGRAAGLLTMSLYFGQFLSPIFMEPIIQNSGISSIFLIFGILLFVIGLLYFLMSLKKKY